jgi:hypothetical protein
MKESNEQFERRLESQLMRLSEPGGSKSAEEITATVMTRPQSLWRPAALVIAAGLAVIVTGGGLAIRNHGLVSASVSPSESASTVPTKQPFASLQYACYRGYAFSPAIFSELETDLASRPPGLALRAFLQSGKDQGAGLPRSGWHLVGIDGEIAVFVAAVDGSPPFAAVSVAVRNGRWRVAGFGRCSPKLEVPGTNPASWVPSQAVAADSQSFEALVTEHACIGGLSSAGRMLAPIIAYRAHSVVVIFMTTPPADVVDSTCIGNPPTAVQVVLDEPLGDRELLDGGTLPWAPVSAGPE